MKSIIASALILLTIASSASAQSLQDADVWRAFAEKLPVGEFVSIRLKNGRHVDGHFLQTDGEVLHVKPKTRIPVAMRTIRFDDVDSIRRAHEGMSPGAKVLMGVGIGAGGFLAFCALLFTAISD